jgi:hypothetical protein
VSPYLVKQLTRKEKRSDGETNLRIVGQDFSGS